MNFKRSIYNNCLNLDNFRTPSFLKLIFVQLENYPLTLTSTVKTTRLRSLANNELRLSAVISTQCSTSKTHHQYNLLELLQIRTA